MTSSNISFPGSQQQPKIRRRSAFQDLQNFDLSATHAITSTFKNSDLESKQSDETVGISQATNWDHGLVDLATRPRTLSNSSEETIRATYAPPVTGADMSLDLDLSEEIDIHENAFLKWLEENPSPESSMEPVSKPDPNDSLSLTIDTRWTDWKADDVKPPLVSASLPVATKEDETNISFTGLSAQEIEDLPIPEIPDEVEWDLPSPVLLQNSKPFELAPLSSALRPKESPSSTSPVAPPKTFGSEGFKFPFTTKKKVAKPPPPSIMDSPWLKNLDRMFDAAMRSLREEANRTQAAKDNNNWRVIPPEELTIIVKCKKTSGRHGYAVAWDEPYAPCYLVFEASIVIIHNRKTKTDDPNAQEDTTEPFAKPDVKKISIHCTTLSAPYPPAKNGRPSHKHGYLATSEAQCQYAVDYHGAQVKPVAKPKSPSIDYPKGIHLSDAWTPVLPGYKNPLKRKEPKDKENSDPSNTTPTNTTDCPEYGWYLKAYIPIDMAICEKRESRIMRLTVDMVIQNKETGEDVFVQGETDVVVEHLTSSRFMV